MTPRTALIAALILFTALAGCTSSTDREVQRVSGQLVKLDESGQKLAFDYKRSEPELTPQERKVLIGVMVDRLKLTGWEEAHDTLVSLGDQAIPALITVVDSDEESHAEVRPRFRADPRGRKKTYTHGEVAHMVLTDIVMHYSNYKGPLPKRSRAAWQNWWDTNRSGLVVIGKGAR